MESGNLRRAVQVYPHEYDLILSPDVNTRGHTQWFYFSVSNTRRASPSSSTRQPRQGRLAVHRRDAPVGVRRARERGGGERWNARARTRATTRTTLDASGRVSGSALYVPSSTPFEHPTDTSTWRIAIRTRTPISNCTCDDWRRTGSFATVRAGDDVRDARRESMRRADHHDAGSRRGLRRRASEARDARARPRGANSSWMMKGAIDFLTRADSLDAKMLRDNFVFKVVPPDAQRRRSARAATIGVPTPGADLKNFRGGPTGNRTNARTPPSGTPRR